MRRILAIGVVLTMVASACSSDVAQTTASGPEASSSPTSSMSSVPPETTTTTIPAAADAVDRLSGLPFDQFVEESFELLFLRTPQFVTDLGITDWYGMRNDQLDDRSDAFLQETMEIEAGVAGLLSSYDRGSLDPNR